MSIQKIIQEELRTRIALALEAKANEEVEQIDEIGDTAKGRKALKAVISRAPEKAANARLRSDVLGRRQFDPDVSSADSERYGNAADKHYKKYQLAVKGAARAVDRLTKEEVEQIDEISKKTLGSYIKKASSDLGYRHGDIERNIISKSGYYGSDEHKKDTIGRRNRRKGIGVAVNKLTSEEVEQIDELSKDTLVSYMKKSMTDRSNTAKTMSDDDYNKMHAARKVGSTYKSPDVDRFNKRTAGTDLAFKKFDQKRRMSEEVELDESTAKMKDGYYVSNQNNSEITHDKPFADSKSAISHANKGEDKSGYVHRVHKVKDGKIDKQWEYNGGHMDGGWEHFSDFKGTDAKGHFRSIPKHFIHGAE